MAYVLSICAYLDARGWGAGGPKGRLVRFALGLIYVCFPSRIRGANVIGVIGDIGVRGRR
jgi:hypothetical protein